MAPDASRFGGRETARAARQRTAFRDWGRVFMNKWLGTMIAGAALAGCQNELVSVEGPISAYRDRMLVQHQQETAAQSEPARAIQQAPPVARPVSTQAQLPPRASLMTQPATTTQPSPADVLRELPDPRECERVFAERLERLRADPTSQTDPRVVRSYERVVRQALDYLQAVRRPEQVELSLAECVQRALESNYTIRIEAHGPAISETQVVEAEAAFDVEFFLDTTWSVRDGAVPPRAYPNTSDTRAIQGGFRKLMPTGMTGSVGLGTSRNWSGAPQGLIKNWNPTWPSNFIVQLRQPLLRGFGLDVNRAQINIAKLDWGISRDLFVQRVRDTIFEVEQTYWNLVRTRRQAAVLAESVAQNFVTYDSIRQRGDFDATRVEIDNALSRWQTAHVNFLESVKLVRDAEDRLKNVLNDPSLKLSDQVELIPIETPVAAPTVLDHFAEVRTALDKRSEILQARKRIDQTRINTNATKNAILPQLDLSFSYEVQGLGTTADNSFDNLTTNRFISYSLAANFAYNFGERRARAAHRRARLQESQAVVALNQITDAVVEEINQVIRQLMVRYEQIPPALTSVQAAERNLRALQARTRQVDPAYLQTELSAVEQLANTRGTLLTVLTDYNVGIVQLEKAKGTLLEYNNVVVSDGLPGR